MSQEQIVRISIIGVMILVVIWRVGAGYRKGLIHEISVLLSLVVAAVSLFLFMLLYSSFKTGTWGTTVTSIIMLIVFSLGYKIGRLILSPLKGLKALSFLNFIDKLLGTVMGMAEALIILYAIQYVLIILEKPVIFPVPKII